MSLVSMSKADMGHYRRIINIVIGLLTGFVVYEMTLYTERLNNGGVNSLILTHGENRNQQQLNLLAFLRQNRSNDPEMSPQAHSPTLDQTKHQSKQQQHQQTNIFALAPVTETKVRNTCNIYEEDSIRNLTVKLNVFNFTVPSDVTVTMIVHMTLERFEVLEKMAVAWKGYISIAVYSSLPAFSTFTNRYFESSQLSARKNIYVHFALKNGTYYPSNALRNVAVDFCASSRYLFLNDIDFIPAVDAEKVIENHIQAGDIAAKQVVVLPAFETMQRDTKVPRNKEILLNMWKHDLVVPFHYPRFMPGHRPTDYNKWKTSQTPYQITYREFYEPYIVIESTMVPRYDQRFVSRYYDKSSHTLLLSHSGFKFLVSPDSFVVHLFHPVGQSQLDVYRCAHARYLKYKKELSDKTKTKTTHD